MPAAIHGSSKISTAATTLRAKPSAVTWLAVTGLSAQATHDAATSARTPSV